MIERSFENIKYVSYPQNDDFDDLSIEYKQRLSIEWQIDCLTGNNVERLKVSLIRWSLDNIGHKSNPRDADFDYLPFDGDERLIARWQLDRWRLYHINDHIVFR